HLCSLSICAPRALTSFPTRRSSDLVLTPGFVNIHTHAVLAMVRGMTEDLGFAPAYTPGVPHCYDVTEEEAAALARLTAVEAMLLDRKSTRLNSSHVETSYAVFCLKK